MAKLSDILKEMGDEVKVQFLSQSVVSVKDKKRTKDTEVTFATNEVDCNSFGMGNKSGIVIWVDNDKYNEAIEKLNKHDN